MCGIAGFIDFHRAPEERVLRDMERTIAHRGPDEGAVWLQGPCGLVHRRLRIIDLSPAAAQPMSNEDRTLWAIFNGEIYNYRALRDELLALGHRFKSRSDTEVLLHGYEAWGTELFRRLRGMFALALWDTCRQEAVLARDRLGKKPLFYLAERERLVFGSELPVFKAVRDFHPRIAAPAVRQYLEFGYVLSPGSILDRVRRLRPGHFAVWNAIEWREEPFWELPLAPNSPRATGTAAEAANELEHSLREAVLCRLESDVPLGCFLSGGIDSSLVAALAHKALPRPLKTYTVGFKDSQMDESGYARDIAKHLGTEHHELVLSEHSVLAEFESLLALAPEPLGDDSFIPTHVISRETRKHVTVALSGDGGDELFAGYDKYRQFLSARRVRQWLPLPWAALSTMPLGDRYQKSAQALAAPGSAGLARWLSTLWKPAEVAALIAAPAWPGNGTDLFEQRWEARPDFPELERCMLTDMETYLEGDILTKVDRASMVVGLEARSPFLDHHLIEEALRWGCRAEIPSGGKAILKELLARHVPGHLFLRPKQGFGMPVQEWFRGALRPVLEKYTSADRLRRRGLLNPEPIQRAVQQHLSGRRNFGRKLYAIMAFEVWADGFFGENAVLA
jgi:asparagine synthase (glutamine-hydrolysing)